MIILFKELQDRNVRNCQLAMIMNISVVPDITVSTCSSKGVSIRQPLGSFAIVYHWFHHQCVY